MSANPTAIEVTAEAICGALHASDFDYLGDTGGGSSTWFHRGKAPQDVRIEVVRSVLAPMVLVNIEFRNLHAPQARRRVRITAQIDVRGAKAEVMEATERAVLRCLELYRDVLQGTGPAGPEAWKERVVHNSADMDVPETEEDERDADL